MQTNPILSPANLVNSNPAPASNAADGAAPETAFNQVLTREVEQQRKNEAPEKTDSKSEAEAPAKPAESSATAPKPNESGTGKDAGKSEEDRDKETAGAPVTGNPADMLALMASLSQAGMTPDTRTVAAQTTSAATAASVDDAASGPVGRKLVNLPGLHVEHNLPRAESEPKAARTGTEFAAALQQAAEANPDADALAKAAGASELAAAKFEVAVKAQELPAPATGATAAVNTAIQPMQQAGLHAVQAAAGQPTEKLAPPVGSSAWDQSLGQKVMWMVAGEQQSASLTLNPPDLGPLHVVLNITNSQANATFIAAQPEVRQALEAAMPKLRDMLGEAGIQLGQATVESGASNQQGGSGDRRKEGSSRGAQGDTQLDTPIRVSRVQATSSGVGLVDTFV